MSPVLPRLHHSRGASEEMPGLLLGGEIQRVMSLLALEVDQVRPGPLELDGGVQLLLPHQFVAHEAVNATVIGPFVGVLDQTQGSRALLDPCGMVRGPRSEQLHHAGAEGLSDVE